MGMGVGPLPAASLDRHVGTMDPDEAAVFRLVMRRLDGVYLAHVNKAPGKPAGKPVRGVPPVTTAEPTVDHSRTFSRADFRAMTGR